MNQNPDRKTLAERARLHNEWLEAKRAYEAPSATADNLSDTERIDRAADLIRRLDDAKKRLHDFERLHHFRGELSG